MPNAKVLIRQSFKPLTKEKKLEVWNKVKARIATGELCEISAKEYEAIVHANREKPYIYRIPAILIPTTFKHNRRKINYDNET